MPDEKPANGGNALVTTPDLATRVATAKHDRHVTMLRPLMDPAALMQQQKATREACMSLLKEGTDYGKFGNVKKNSLMQPGAETLCGAFGIIPRFRIVEEEIDHHIEIHWRKTKARWENNQRVGEDVTEGVSQGLYRYVVECEGVLDDGRIVGAALGAASTLEGKYIDRPRDSEHTILLMATKRAHVAMTRRALGISGEFTQDIEDDPDRYSGDSRTDARVGARSPEETVMKFGLPHIKGKKIKELDVKALEDSKRWAVEKGAFPDIVAAIDAALAGRRAAAEQAAAQVKPDGGTATGGDGTRPSDPREFSFAGPWHNLRIDKRDASGVPLVPTHAIEKAIKAITDLANRPGRSDEAIALDNTRLAALRAELNIRTEEADEARFAEQERTKKNQGPPPDEQREPGRGPGADGSDEDDDLPF